MNAFTWGDLPYWQSGEWQVVEERLQTFDELKLPYCPGRDNLFKALDLVDFEDVVCMWVGQDPYPSPKHATGLAFSIPRNVEAWPQTLTNIINEYLKDLHLDYPKSGNLEPWTTQGVLLWNSLPTCRAYESMSHNWPEWHMLTQQIIEKLSEKGCVFLFLGSFARNNFAKYVDTTKSDMLCVAHPSPRAHHKFSGSRIFSTINDKLVNRGLEPIDWRL